MKLQFPKTFLLICAVAISAISIVGCKSKVSDASVKTAIETSLKSAATFEGVVVDVKDGVATLSGQCKDEATKAACVKAAESIKGVKSVTNNLTVAAPAAMDVAPVVAADDAITSSVNTALKAFPGVSATVKDGVVSLAGKIAKMDRQKLMMILQSLNLKKLDMAGLLNK